MRRAAALLLAGALLAVGCGDDEDGGPGEAAGGGSGDAPRLVVSAASSMTAALEACSPDFEDADVRLSFAGSDELAAQIRQGVKPDVYAAANTSLPADLAKEGLLEEPVEFATNELVVAVPEDSPVESVEDLAAPGTVLAVGSETVPIGSYTREVLARLPEAQATAILHNVRSNELDVKGIVGKLTQGAADAGFVYTTDVEATGGRLRAVTLPAHLQPTVVYAAGVVEGAEQPELAQEYLDGLVDGGCQAALREAGFGAAPR